MPKIEIHHNQPFFNQTTEPLVIEIAEEVPALKASENGYLDEYRIFYRMEGRALADALWQHLPGGTLDQLLIALLEKRASLMRTGYEVAA